MTALALRIFSSALTAGLTYLSGVLRGGGYGIPSKAVLVLAAIAMFATCWAAVTDHHMQLIALRRRRTVAEPPSHVHVEEAPPAWVNEPTHPHEHVGQEAA